MVDTPKPAYASCTYPQRSKRDYTGRTGGFFFSFSFSFSLCSSSRRLGGGTGGAGGRTEGRKKGRKKGRQTGCGSFLRNYVSSQMRLLHRLAGDAHVPVDTGTKYPGHGVSGLAGT